MIERCPDHEVGSNDEAPVFELLHSKLTKIV